MKSLRDLITLPKVLTLHQSATVFEAARAMQRVHVGATLVVDDSDKPVGIFTERDLMTRVIVGERDPRTCLLEEVMTREIFVAAPDGRANDVAREMQARHIRHIPVVDGDKVLGILSLRDLLRAHLEAKRHEVQALTAYIQGESEGQLRREA